jgi:hypothetical protein
VCLLPVAMRTLRAVRLAHTATAVLGTPCSHTLNKPVVCVKVKFTLEQGTKAQRGSRGIALLFYLTLALDRGGWSTPRPGRFTPGKETRYPLYRRLGGPQGRSGRMLKISPQRDSIPGPSSP